MPRSTRRMATLLLHLLCDSAIARIIKFFLKIFHLRRCSRDGFSGAYEAVALGVRVKK